MSLDALKRQQLLVLKEKERRLLENRLDRYLPDDGPFARSNYPKHIEILKAPFHQRAFMGGNGCGKTMLGAAETAYHATGQYPHWWEGKRFEHPVDIWVIGRTGETTRDGPQTKLLGDVAKRGEEALGTGLIPKSVLGKPHWKSGGQRAVDYITVRHVSGGMSTIQFKSHEQGATSFEAVERHFLWFDEEPPNDIYNEAIMRTRSVGGIALLTFTPIEGWTDVVERFMNASADPELAQVMFMVTVGMDEVPHLDETEKRNMLAGKSSHEIQARRDGTPTIGEGGIYTPHMSWDQIIVEPFKIPDHWPRLVGMDIGFSNPTAIVWGAWDQDADIRYIYAEWAKAQAMPSDISFILKARGDWMNVMIDPASDNARAGDGERVFRMFRNLGLNVCKADNAVWAGINEITQRLVSERIKVFSTCDKLKKEYERYRQKDGKVVKVNDHLLDAVRYLNNAPPKMWTLKPMPSRSAPRQTEVTFGVT